MKADKKATQPSSSLINQALYSDPSGHSEEQAIYYLQLRKELITANLRAEIAKAINAIDASSYEDILNVRTKDLLDRVEKKSETLVLENQDASADTYLLRLRLEVVIMLTILVFLSTTCFLTKNVQEQLSGIEGTSTIQPIIEQLIESLIPEVLEEINTEMPQVFIQAFEIAEVITDLVQPDQPRQQDPLPATETVESYVPQMAQQYLGEELDNWFDNAGTTGGQEREAVVRVAILIYLQLIRQDYFFEITNDMTYDEALSIISYILAEAKTIIQGHDAPVETKYQQILSQIADGSYTLPNVVDHLIELLIEEDLKTFPSGRNPYRIEPLLFRLFSQESSGHEYGDSFRIDQESGLIYTSPTSKN